MPIWPYRYRRENLCQFGRIVIDGRIYASDLIIYPDGHIEDSWHRQNGHMLSIDDINQLIASEPEIIVAGTGIFGRMKPERDLEKLLHRMDIRFISKPNKKAMKLYNELSPTTVTGACFHLTC